MLLENTRFHEGDEAGDAIFAKELAALGDFYVNDAFGAAHRPHASVSVVAQNFAADAKFPGLLLRKEVKWLSEALWHPQRPLACVVGGAKVTDKIGVLHTLVSTADVVVVGGRMAFTFLAAKGISVGDTVIEADKVESARAIMEEAKRHNCAFVLPCDVVVGDHLDPGVTTHIEPLTVGCCTSDAPCIAPGKVGGDIGPDSCVLFRNAIKGCKTVFWNGPLGRFETPEYANGTLAVAEVLDELSRKKAAVTIVGGGDSVSAVMQFGLGDNMTHISTGGGASLEFIEGKAMPGIECFV